MNRFFTFLEGLFFKKIDARGLAIFRMAYVLIVFLELRQLNLFAPIIYDPVPFLLPSEFKFSLAFTFWKIILLMIGLGLFTRWAVMLNYLLSVVVLHSIVQYEYHVFYSYVAVNILLLFMPISRMWSIDALIAKVKTRRGKEWIAPDTKVFAINYLFPVFTVIGLVYFDSILYKFTSPMWMKGLGMWLPANLPVASWNEHVIVSNMKWLVKSMGYLVIIFETVFIFLIWFKPFRIPLLLIGMGLHLGIFIEFPIPWFALAACGVYLLMVPVWVWKLFDFKPSSNPFRVFYDDNYLVYNRLAVLVKGLDAFNRIEVLPKSQYSGKLDSGFASKGMFGVDSSGEVTTDFEGMTAILKHLIWTIPLFVLLKLPLFSQFFKWLFNSLSTRLDNEKLVSEVMPQQSDSSNPIFKGWNKLAFEKFAWFALFFIHIYFQFMVSVTSALPNKVYIKTGFNQSKLYPYLNRISSAHERTGLAYFGITHHPVFMDFHFDGYNHILRIAYENEDGTETTLPIINEKGMPGEYVRGAFWVNYTFRTSCPYFTWNMYHYGISRYARYWLRTNEMTLSVPRKFKIYVAKMEVPKDWENDFLHKSIKALNWVPAAEFEVNGRNEEFKKIIEDLETY
ncbi:MAG TPA: hypothetical protein PKY12_03515 [Catalimonadaceae bacterium]|nr:hypothetical protein [Catalimonadaceae bacterium]